MSGWWLVVGVRERIAIPFGTVVIGDPRCKGVLAQDAGVGSLKGFTSDPRVVVKWVRHGEIAFEDQV